MNPILPADDQPRAPAGAKGDLTPTVTMKLVPPSAVEVEREPGESIGRYRLLQKLGEGGCGVVYLAEQSEPVRRRVALKVIKLGMDTKAVIARFEAERQVLAMMEHPNIAKVFDAGATEAGRPYFVMELVRGLRITEYCDQHNTSTPERLALFTQVCSAIQHAHQKGIIHRDLKPSNIMVAVQDGVAVPKVIDFGIAKTMHGRLTDSTVFTAIEQFIGTPAYMSPEQAELSGLDIDTRTDIYSLGVVLYEMLTGRLPFNPQTLADSGRDEIRRMIREVEPPRPSARLQTLAAADFTTVARQRGTIPAHLSTEVRGDLDWIVMKALEKQRNRRYESAAAFAADIRRHLDDEPVIARPPSAVYRWQKFVVRHKYGVGAAAAVALTLLVGAVVSTWQAVRAGAAERVANQERSKAVEARLRADDLLDFMLGDLRTEVQKVGKLDLLEKVGEKAMTYFSSLDPHDLNDTTLTRQARALTQIGEIRMNQKNYGEALVAFSNGYQRAAVLTSRHPMDTTVLFERGQAEYWLGVVRRRQGEAVRAKEWLTRYRDTAAALVALEPTKQEWQEETTYGLHNLAVLKMDNGDIAGARTDFAAKLAVIKTMAANKPGDLKLAFRIYDTESWLGNVAEQEGDFRLALQQFDVEGRGLIELLKAEPKNIAWRYERADNLSIHARVLSVTGRRDEAKRCLSEARSLIDSVTAHDPGNRSWAELSYRIRLREASLAAAEGNLVEAGGLAAAARAGCEAILVKAPKDVRAIAGLCAALRIEAELHAMKNPAAAREAVSRMLALGEELVRLEGVGPDEISQHAQSLVTAAQMALEPGRKEAGLAQASRAMDLLAPRLEHANDWRLLDPAVRALTILGRSERKVLLQSRLDKMGYVPLVPWPPPAPARN